MSIEILCRPLFTANEIAAIDRIAKSANMTHSEVVRRAVALFSAKCVPTHSRRSKGKAKI